MAAQQLERLARTRYWNEVRSTIANVETGHQKVPRDFWEDCDTVLGADGTFVTRVAMGVGVLARLHQQIQQILVSMRDAQQPKPKAYV